MDLLLQGSSLELGALAFLLLALFIALGFEFINGFHDTANAVATVIYTNSLQPTQAVVLSGLCNFLGVMLSGVGVAYAMVNLLPVELLVNVDGGQGFAMVFAVLIAAVIWNLGTWYVGIPASSSHTLIGSIIGVGLIHSSHGVHWDKAAHVGLSLLISPIVGFGLAAVLLLILKKVVKDPELYSEPKKDEPPPLWIRAILIFTCSGVSLAHGSNDGQKGMGLIMLILIGLVPSAYALNLAYPPAEIQAAVQSSSEFEQMLMKKYPDATAPEDIEKTLEQSDGLTEETAGAAIAESQRVRELLTQADNLKAMPEADRWELRTDLLLLNKALKDFHYSDQLSQSEREVVDSYQFHLKGMTEYVTEWVKIAVALALGLGTMIGWKRIVVTVGEKIGKTHLTYAQGASAELVAMSTIVLADLGGLPVSTTHVLSSGVAGTMVANNSGVQGKTVKNILLAWVLTLPVSMALSAGLFLLFQLIA